MDYPLTIKFPYFSFKQKFTVYDQIGNKLFKVSKTIFSTKDEVEIRNANGEIAYKIVSQESKISEIPSNWDVITASGEVLGVIGTDFANLVESNTFGEGQMASLAADFVESMATTVALKMYIINNTNNNPIGKIVPLRSSMAMQQLPFLQTIISKFPFGMANRFINPEYNITMGENKVMSLKKLRTMFIDKYTLDLKVKMTEKEEQLFLSTSLLVILNERAFLKAMYS